eukprot:235052-Amphidinium_carterae.1
MFISPPKHELSCHKQPLVIQLPNLNSLGVPPMFGSTPAPTYDPLLDPSFGPLPGAAPVPLPPPGTPSSSSQGYGNFVRAVADDVHKLDQTSDGHSTGFLEEHGKPSATTA